MMRAICLLSAVFLLCNLLFLPDGVSAEGGGISFVGESVLIEVVEWQHNGYGVHVRGLYHFHNFSGRKVERRIFYPFPLDEGSLYPETVSLNYSGDTKDVIGAIPFARLAKGVAFVLEAGSGSDRIVEVNYAQRLSVPRAVYITTTTATWVKPLANAEFIVSLPERLRMSEISYPPDQIIKRDGRTSYIVRYVDFMPSEDLVVSWEGPAATPEAGSRRTSGTLPE